MSSTLNAIMANGDFSIENDDGTIIDYSSPVWTPSANVNEGPYYSYFPALFGGGHETAVLSAQVTIGAEYNGASLHLLGQQNGNVVFQSDSTGGQTGSLSLAVHACFDASSPAQIAGDIEWTIQLDDGRHSAFLATSRLELYWIYAAPRGVFQHAANTSLLRTLFEGINIGGSPAAVCANLVRLCFYGMNKTYDTVSGAAHFGCGYNGGTFELGNYLYTAGAPQELNCYDQAGAVQVFLDCIGLDSQWLYLEPFGYILPTDLIGIGACNNPFFSSNGTSPMIGQDNLQRTPFGRHAFITLDGVILDACAGPHLGNEPAATYVANAIDTATTLATPDNTGNASQIQDEPGIGSLSLAPVAREDLPYREGLRSLLGEQDAVRAGLPDHSARVNWDTLLKSICSAGGMQVVRSSRTPAPDGVFAQWLLSDGQAVTRLRIFQARRAATAWARELEHLDAFQNEPARCMRAAPALGAAGLHSIDARQWLYVHRNVFVVVSGEAIQAERIAGMVFAALTAAPVRTSSPTHTHTSASLAVGQRHSIQSAGISKLGLKGEVARIVARDDQHIDLMGTRPGTGRLDLVTVIEPWLELDWLTVYLNVS